MSETDHDERLGDKYNGSNLIQYEVPDENGWEQLELASPTQPQLLAEDTEYKRIADEGVYDPSLDQDQDWPTEQVKVWVARSQPRDKFTGAIAFDISFEYAQWKHHRVSILALMDLEDNSFPYEEVTDAVNDWIDKANRFPNNRRNCICCNKKAIKGKILCKGCNSKYGKLIYAD